MLLHDENDSLIKIFKTISRWKEQFCWSI